MRNKNKSQAWGTDYQKKVNANIVLAKTLVWLKKEDYINFKV